jgi:hypothetical protein
MGASRDMYIGKDGRLTRDSLLDGRKETARFRI